MSASLLAELAQAEARVTRYALRTIQIRKQLDIKARKAISDRLRYLSQEEGRVAELGKKARARLHMAVWAEALEKKR